MIYKTALRAIGAYTEQFLWPGEVVTLRRVVVEGNNVAIAFEDSDGFAMVRNVEVDDIIAKLPIIRARWLALAYARQKLPKAHYCYVDVFDMIETDTLEIKWHEPDGSTGTVEVTYKELMLWAMTLPTCSIEWIIEGTDPKTWHASWRKPEKIENLNYEVPTIDWLRG